MTGTTTLPVTVSHKLVPFQSSLFKDPLVYIADLEALETVDSSSPVKTAKDKASGMRLSHAESTDSGMGFSENLKEGDASRLSAGDGYGTIHLINPPPLEEQENRKSLLDGDVEYDEVMDFISSPTQPEPIQDNPPFSTFKTPPKSTQQDTVKSPGDSASKYAELDVAVSWHVVRLVIESIVTFIVPNRKSCTHADATGTRQRLVGD